MRTIYASTFANAFKMANTHAILTPDFVSETRIGKAYEILNLGIVVNDPRTFVFNQDPEINRISYKYAEDFWSFMISGGTDAQEAFKAYPQVSKFLDKPKSTELPANFNTFYGPRIAEQYPMMFDEMVRSPNTRRAVITILDGGDAALLDKDETLEYPCTISYSFQIRNKTLFMSTVMRSQNLATVFQLDIYLQGKLLKKLADELDEAGVEIERTHWTGFLQNAHVFERDEAYVNTFRPASEPLGLRL